MNVVVKRVDCTKKAIAAVQFDHGFTLSGISLDMELNDWEKKL